MSRVFTSRKSANFPLENGRDADLSDYPSVQSILINTSTRMSYPYSSGVSPQSMRSPAQMAFKPSDVQVTVSRPGTPEWRDGCHSARAATFANLDGEGVIEENEDGISFRAPLRRRTQLDQDKDDDTARKKALKGLVQSWMDRLQLISLITTFFAATEAELLGSTTPDDGEPVSRTLIAANAGFVGALVLHIFAAIVSFLAAFYLIRYRVQEATVEELRTEGFPNVSLEVRKPKPSGSLPASQAPIVCSQEPKLSTPTPFIHDHPRPALNPTQPTYPDDAAKAQSSGLRRLEMELLGEMPIVSRNPHLEQVGPFRSHQPPTHLLERAHSLCMALSVVGFVSAIIGIVCSAIAVQPRVVGIVASVATAACVFGSLGVMVLT